jgi:uncharacterized coiled-coil protein SlyX
VCLYVYHITLQVTPCYFQLQEQPNKQISISETLSRKLNESDAVISHLNTTIDGLTKTVEALNQAVRWLCERTKDVSTCKIDAVSVFTNVR